MALEFTDSNFAQEVEKSNGVVLIDFWAPWCGPCKVQGPIVEDIAQQFAGKPNVKIGKLNVDENPKVAEQHQILSIPTILIFKNGVVVDQAIGLQSKNSILMKLSRQVPV